ncbi:hypothetical protein KSX_93100 [Ktedonospora formicarum]|uniref:Uncharacterized protein n=1 Tax=Ktedonospora formicarum TaxID=2778364 RepID=A0A8J3IBG4_9CHLR|nr:hypothetical protein KSX_73960 [Ktedonospora formicarum]GHO51147.1 hypothetical protein KSX_93100 [Ktedonospora formicarum]
MAESLIFLWKIDGQEGGVWSILWRCEGREGGGDATEEVLMRWRDEFPRFRKYPKISERKPIDGMKW